LGTYDQKGQTVQGNQINTGRDANIEQVGDRYQIEQAHINLPPEIIQKILAAGEQEDYTVAELKTERWEPETVFIPNGSFLMGSQPGDGIPVHETPQFEITLPAYRMGKYPVTNEQYAHFVWKTGRVVSPSLHWNGNAPPDDALAYPVTAVTWYEALAYCEWLSASTSRLYTLPTEAQWEKAARGEDGRIYPWGNEWDSTRCNADFDTITSVKAYPAQNEVGCFDMVGNGREWTSTIWGAESRQPDQKFTYPWQDDRRNELSEPSTTRRIFRSGKAKEPIGFRCTARGGYLPEKSGPKRNRHGFRVVLLPTN